MNHARLLYRMILADFLERVRRYSFLLSLAFAVYLGYAVHTGQIVLQFESYRGVKNSAWIGSLVALTGTVFLTFVGFYIVKNAIQRDRETRVGRILATTPMSKSFYTLSKSLSNFAVLAAMVLVLAAAALLIQLLNKDDPHLDAFALFSPVLMFGLPAVAVTASLAVLFETLPGLRGGAGNIIYFFVWTALLVLGIGALETNPAGSSIHSFEDYTGIASVMGQMRTHLQQIDPRYRGGSSFTLGSLNQTTKTFLWNGVNWHWTLVLSRALWLGIAVGLALFASVFFDRFDPARERRQSEKQIAERSEAGEQFAVLATAEPVSASQLTPLLRRESRNRFFSLIKAELLLLLRGRAWWWYGGAAILFIACLASPLAVARSVVIVAAWLWPVLLWSPLGTREAQFSTGPLIFSAQHAFSWQLLSSWIAGVLAAALTGGGLALHLLLGRDFAGLGAWAAGALFIPALALALGVLSESRKPFEALYTAWWYVGPAHHIPKLDFMGATRESSTPLLYLGLSVFLLTTACIWRKMRLLHN